MKLLRRHHHFVSAWLGTLLFNGLYLLKWVHTNPSAFDPVSEAVVSIALLQFVWCLFVCSMYRSLEKRRKYTAILYVSAAFPLGCLLQLYGYLSYVQSQQAGFYSDVPGLADAKLHYMGMVFAVWFCFVLLVERLCRRPVKKTLHSVIRYLFHLYVTCMHYLFLVFFLDNAFRFLTGWWDWEEYTQTLLWWSYTSLPYLIVSFFFAIVLVTFLAVRIGGAAAGFQKDQFHRTVSSGSCRRLVLYVVPDDILRVPSASPYWLYFLFLNGNNASLTRNLSAFRKGDDYFTCYMAYARQELRAEDFEEKVCLYTHSFLLPPEYNPEQEQKILDFLQSMERKGFHIIVHQHGYAVGDAAFMDIQIRLLNQTLLYSPYLSVTTERARIPLDHMNQYEARREAKKVYLDIRQQLLPDGDPFLERELYDLCAGYGVVAQFYTLLKMAEYCIHIRALCMLCRRVIADPKVCEKIVNPSFGTLCDLQQEPERIFSDPGLAGALRWLDMLSCAKSTSQIRTRRASYAELCQVMVRLRNRFIGHGTMIYSINEQVLPPLAAAVSRLVQVFLEGAHHLTPDARVLPSMPEYSLPAFLETEAGRFCFAGVDPAGYISYLDFSTGKYVSTHRDRPLEPVHLDIPACEDTDSCPAFPAGERILPLSDPDAEKARRRFLRKWSVRLITMWTFYQDTDVFHRMLADLNCPYMTRPYWEEEYMEKILHRDATPDIYHNFLLETAHCVIHLFEAPVWDRILDSWDGGIPFLRKYVMELAEEGELLPGIPLKIGVLGAPAHALSDPYPWMISLEIQNFDSYEALLGWASNTSAGSFRRKLGKNARKQGAEWSLFLQRTAFYRTLLEELDCPSPLISPNLYFSGFFKNLFDYDDIETSAMAVFDFLEFTMLCVQYYLLGSQGIQPERSLVNPDFQSIGEIILSCCPADEPVYETLHHRSVALPAHCLELQERLTQYLPFAIQGSRMDFKNLTRILRLLRNATRGHGFIQEDNAVILWQLLLYYALICCKLLKLQDFRLDVSDGRVLIGYADGRIPLSDYFIIQNEVPCPLWELKKQKRQYINYFHGMYVVPDLVKQEFSSLPL